MVLRNKLSGAFISHTRLSRFLADHSGSFCYEYSHRISSALQPSLAHSARELRSMKHEARIFVIILDSWILILESLVPCTSKFRLFRFRSPLLTESRLIYFPGATLDVSVGAVPHLKLLSRLLGNVYFRLIPILLELSCLIRKPPDQRLLAPPRRVSPLSASFLGQNLLGIHYRHYE